MPDGNICVYLLQAGFHIIVSKTDFKDALKFSILAAHQDLSPLHREPLLVNIAQSLKEILEGTRGCIMLPEHLGSTCI